MVVAVYNLPKTFKQNVFTNASSFKGMESKVVLKKSFVGCRMVDGALLLILTLKVYGIWWFTCLLQQLQ